MQKLTKLEAKVFDFICDYWEKNGFSPSTNDIAKGCYIAKQTAHNYIMKLYDKGYISYVPNVSRSFVIKKRTNVS